MQSKPIALTQSLGPLNLHLSMLDRSISLSINIISSEAHTGPLSRLVQNSLGLYLLPYYLQLPLDVQTSSGGAHSHHSFHLLVSLELRSNN